MFPSSDTSSARSTRTVVSSDTLRTVFELADEIHQGLANVRPSLSGDQLEQINDVLFQRLVQRCIGDFMVNESSLRDAFGHLLARLDTQPSAPWTSFVVRTLYVLNSGAGLDSGLFILNIWRIVGLPAEEKYDGLGCVILRACIDSSSVAIGRLSEVGAESWLLTWNDLKVVMDSAIVTLRRRGNPPPSSQPTTSSVRLGGKVETSVLALSPCGLRLVLDVASHILGKLQLLTGELSAEDGQKPRKSDLNERFEAWRWDLHLEV